MKLNTKGKPVFSALLIVGVLFLSTLCAQNNPGFPPVNQGGNNVRGLLAGEDNSGDESETPVGPIILSDHGTQEVLDMLQNLTGRAILRQQSLPAVKINFETREPMRKSEAIMVIESLLSLNGIAITEVGEYLKAVPSAAAVSQVPRMLDGTAFVEGPSQKIFSKFYKLDFLNVTEAVPLIQPLLSMGAPIVYEKSNAMLVTDAIINLQRVENILQQIDKPADLIMATLFFQLKHVSATEIAKRLQAMQSGSLRRFLENNTTFDADDRTNQLIVFTHRSNEDMIRNIVEKLDIDVAPLTQTEIYYIKHGDATEITSLIEQIITGQQRSRENSRGNAGGRRSTKNTTQGGNQAPDPIAAVTTTANNRMAEVLETAAKNLQFSDYLTIVADARGNAILASGTTSDLTYLKEIIDKVDILLAQVRIDVVIAEVSLEKNQASGINSFDFTWNYAEGTDGAYATDTFSSGFTSSLFDIAVGSATRVGGHWTSLDLTSFILKAAKTRSSVKVLSNPTIVTTHNKEASISVGEEVPVVTQAQNSNDTVSSYGLRSTVQYKKVGIELKVKPLIGSNDIVQLEIDQKVDDILDTAVSVGANIPEQPKIGTRQATSYVSVGDGELIILGGLQSLKRDGNESRLPILGFFPFLRGKSNKETRKELIIFIRPTIVRSTAAGHVQTLDEIDKSPNEEELEEFLNEGKFSSEEIDVHDSKPLN